MEDRGFSIKISVIGAAQIKIKPYYHSFYGERIVGIFLYGSYARGDYNSESDIDIAAVVKDQRVEFIRDVCRN